jgi:hypothetical protein
MASADWLHIQKLFIRYQNHDESVVRELFIELQRYVRSFLLSKGLASEAFSLPALGSSTYNGDLRVDNAVH